MPDEPSPSFESGVTVTVRRLWAGVGARVRYRDDDYPLDAVQVRGGVHW